MSSFNYYATVQLVRVVIKKENDDFKVLLSTNVSAFHNAREVMMKLESNNTAPGDDDPIYTELFDLEMIDPYDLTKVRTRKVASYGQLPECLPKDALDSDNIPQ